MNSSIELLESRIAPAVSTVAFVDSHTATYTDVDGDLVTVKFSNPILTATNINTVLRVGGAGEGNFVKTLALDGTAGLATSAAGTDITVSVKAAPLGDGLAEIGDISAPGIDLGTVKIQGDLSGITAGSNGSSNVAIAKLDVQSMNLHGTLTGGDGLSNIAGQLGTLLVATDIDDAQINIFDNALATNGKIGSLFIGGSIQDGALIKVSGSIGPVHVGKVQNQGEIRAAGDIGAVTVPGGFDGDNSLIDSTDGGVASVKIGGASAGFAGVVAKKDIGPVKLVDQFAGVVESTAGSIGTVKVAGSLRGSVLAAVNLGAVSIPGDFYGALNADAGLLTSVKIGGSEINGGIAATNIGSIRIAHDLVFDGGGGGALIVANSAIGSLTVGGSTLSISNAAIALVGIKFGPIKIGHDLGAALAAISSGGQLTSAHIGGSVLNNGSLSADTLLGPVFIGGDLTGEGGLVSKNGSITSVHIGGSVSGSVIQAHTNIGPVSIGHSFTATSSLTATIGSIGDVRVGDSISGDSVIKAGIDLLSLHVGQAVTSSQVTAIAGIIASISVGSNVVSSDIVAKGNISAITVGGDFEGASVSSMSGEITSLTIHGSVLDGSLIDAANDLGTALIGGNLDTSAIDSGGAITSLKIIGSVLSSDSTPASISATAKLGSVTVGCDVNHALIQSAIADIGAIKIAGAVADTSIGSLGNIASISIGGDFVRSNIIARGSAGAALTVGPISIHGNGLDSNIIAGVRDNGGTGFGDNDDTRVSSSSTITSITVGGAVVSDGLSVKHLAFEAQEIGSVSIAGHALALQVGSDNDRFALSSPASDYTLVEVP